VVAWAGEKEAWRAEGVNKAPTREFAAAPDVVHAAVVVIGSVAAATALLTLFTSST
jgi:hypothetical protein